MWTHENYSKGFTPYCLLGDSVIGLLAACQNRRRKKNPNHLHLQKSKISEKLFFLIGKISEKLTNFKPQIRRK